jgi:hypothetical protein
LPFRLAVIGPFFFLFFSCRECRLQVLTSSGVATNACRAWAAPRLQSSPRFARADTRRQFSGGKERPLVQLTPSVFFRGRFPSSVFRRPDGRPCGRPCATGRLATHHGPPDNPHPFLRISNVSKKLKEGNINPLFGAQSCLELEKQVRILAISSEFLRALL